MMLSIPSLLVVILFLTTILTFILFSIHNDTSSSANHKVKLSKHHSKKRPAPTRKKVKTTHANPIRTSSNTIDSISDTIKSIGSSSKRGSIYGKSNSLTVSKDYQSRPVYMDWFLPSDSFTYINYKSLESVLSEYNSSIIKVIHLGPMSADYYKVGDMISKHFCMKYQKMGYSNLVVDVQGYNKRKEVPFAQKYFDDTIGMCCKVFKTSDINNKKDVPFHLHVYFRLLNLYEQPGMFTDFTWFHRKKSAAYFDGIENGFIMVTSCDNVSLKCSTSMIMIFEDNTIPACMLKKYENDVDFITCINNDIATGGSTCIKDALTKCFTTNHIMNKFLYSPAVMSNLEKSQKMWTRSIESDKQYRIFKAIWLGKKSLNGRWVLPAAGSTLSSLIASDINLTRHDELNFIQSQQSKGLNCSLQRSTCYNYNMKTLPKIGKYTNSSIVQASVSCTMHFAIAGFMKSGSTFLFNTIAQHPQVVKLLRGVGFKESGCYLPEVMNGLKSVDRMVSILHYIIESYFNTYYITYRTAFHL